MVRVLDRQPSIDPATQRGEADNAGNYLALPPRSAGVNTAKVYRTPITIVATRCHILRLNARNLISAGAPPRTLLRHRSQSHK